MDSPLDLTSVFIPVASNVVGVLICKHAQENGHFSSYDAVNKRSVQIYFNFHPLGEPIPLLILVTVIECLFINLNICVLFNIGQEQVDIGNG